MMSHHRAPVRLAHLGLGVFHRAHQAWYTQHAGDGADWGIAGFTVRSAEAARVLAAQECRYTLIERGPADDRAEIVDAVVAAHDGADAGTWLATVADPAVAVVTLTVTEAGYAAGALPPARLVAALAARRAAGAGPIALVSCDNLLGNGRALRAAVMERADDTTRRYVDDAVSFVDTMVDRITPSTTGADRAVARELTGFDDQAPVVTEPFREWVLAGAFPAGRPAWETAGARFVDDVGPYEERKLWLLNAAHTALASSGRLAGYATVAEAFADAALRDAVEALWAEQRVVVALPDAEVDEALAALRSRFANPRIRHGFDKIGLDGAVKVANRIVAPARRRVEHGLGVGEAQRAAIAAWLACAERFPEDDPASAPTVAALAAEPAGARIDLVIQRLDAAGGLSA